MAVGKNSKVSKKGGKKKTVDPFSRKEWYDVRAPAMFTERDVGKTLVNRTQGTRIASDFLKGRVYEVSLSDLTKSEIDYRKFRLICEEVKGRHCLTNFHGMTFTRDKLCSIIKKWHTLIEAQHTVKTADGYVLRLFVIGFTKRSPNQVKKTSYAQSSKVRQIRAKMLEFQPTMTGKERRESTSSSGTSDSSSDEETVETKPSDDNVLNKYTMAGEVANTVLKEVLAKVKEGAVVGELCDHGDRRIVELTEKLFNKVKVGNKTVKVQKGIAMPTCISVDNVVCHFSPLKSEEPVVLKAGQVVKVDLGAHLDGFVGLAAHTVVVGADNKENKVTGKKADVIVAAHQCLEAALRQLHPSRNQNSLDITDAIAKITKSYGVTAVQDMVSHQLDRYKITGDKQITQNPSDEQRPKLEKHTFENYDVFTIDVLISTGDGKAKLGDQRTTVFKKADDAVYSLKMKASRLFFSEVSKRFQNLPFSLRMFEKETAAKMGLLECTNHGLITPYNVMVEKEGDLVAHFKATALILPNGVLKTAGLPFESDVYQTDAKVEDEFLAGLLKEQLKPKKKKKPAAGGDEKKPAADAPKAEEKPAATKPSPKKDRGRVYEVSLSDLTKSEIDYRKFRLICEEVKGRHCLTNFHGMTFTRDKLCSIIKKWHTLIEAQHTVKTADGYVLRLFVIGFTKRSPNQVKKTSYAQSSKVRQIRAKMVDIIQKEVSQSDLRDVVTKLIPDSIGKDIEKACSNLYPLSDVYIRKVKVVKKPRFDLAKLLELHGELGSGGGGAGLAGAKAANPDVYEPPIQESV
ncbi:hypothetical protein M3Y99_01177500 [Aphelenchoides fujianensis]|nr:hypothetical protein M3Y99_01177500 [Aphelenchoides fujianensis]